MSPFFLCVIVKNVVLLIFFSKTFQKQTKFLSNTENQLYSAFYLIQLTLSPVQ